MEGIQDASATVTPTPTATQTNSGQSIREAFMSHPTFYVFSGVYSL